jgi:predicted DNA-binding transcriptional regulator YafY
MKADRLMALLLLLQSSTQRTARELADKLEVSERTIYRDVDALSAAGVPVYTERGSTGGIALAEGYRKALTHFGEEEVRALFASGSSALADLGLGAQLDRALEKLRGGLSDAQRSAAEHVRARVHIDQRRWNQGDPPVEKLALLRRVVWDDRRIELRYEDRHRTATTRDCDPLGLVSKAGVWYLIARTAEGYRTFRVDRIADLTELSGRFERPADFDLDSYWRETMQRFNDEQNRGYSVVVRCSREIIDDMTSYWPWEIVEDGDPATLRVRFSNLDTALHNLFAWGCRVSLVEPEELRARVCARAQEMLAHYALAK